MGGGEVIKKGWLVKSPPLEGGGIKAWRKRFFMLRSSKVLEYYKSEAGEVQKGVINLEDCKTVHSDLSHKKYKNVFDIETKERIYYLVAQSQQEMKAWVDILCRVCGLMVQDVVEFIPTIDPGPLPPPVTGTSSVAGPLISTPIYATPPSRAGGGVPFNERFKPSEAVAMESLYSLAHCAESEVQRQLSTEQEVAAGTPLSEALASKGLISSAPRTASISSASGRDANASLGSDPSSFLSPRNDPVPDMQNLYSPIPKKPSGGMSGGGVGGGVGVVRPVPKPRGNTLNPRSPDQESQRQPDPPVWGPRAETLPTGYLQPRQINRAGNYDQLPPGPPRPAAPSRLADQALASPPSLADPPRPVVRQMPTAQPQKHHRSALLRDVPSQGELQPDPAPTASGPAPTAGGPTYINVKHMSGELPPTISRMNKPSPPRVDRKLKPRQDSEGSLDISAMFATRACAEEDHHSDDSESPPDFPMRTSSLANALEAAGPSSGPPSSGPPSSGPPSSGPPSSGPPSSGRDEFCERDLPKLSPHTMQYTQVEFDAVTGKHSIVESNGLPSPVVRKVQGSPPEARRMPVPVPRPRVNYCDVDLVATNALKVSRDQVTLVEAEMKALKDKPYINVSRNGGVDDESDPDYYTHMRNLTYEEAFEIYNSTSIDADNDDDVS